MVLDLSGKILFHSDRIDHKIVEENPAIIRAVSSKSSKIQKIMLEGKQYYDVTVPII